MDSVCQDDPSVNDEVMITKARSKARERPSPWTSSQGAHGDRLLAVSGYSEGQKGKRSRAEAQSKVII